MTTSFLDTREELEREIQRLGLAIDVGDDPGPLLQPLPIGGRTVPNRLCAQPMAGEDGGANGAPAEYTVRRYRRLARGGFGTIWFEATDVGPGEHGHLRLHEETAGAFARCVDSLRELSPEALLILQLWRSPDGARPEQVRDDYLVAAALAAGAGFDGVDVACCHGNFLSRSLTPEPHGPALEDRARLLREIVRGIRTTVPGKVIAVRVDAFHARANGFGVDAHDYRRMDLAEPLALAAMLYTEGVDILSVTAETPNLFGDPSIRAKQPLSDTSTPHEHPLTVLARHHEIGRRIRQAVPGLTIVCGGYSWLRHLAADMASAAISRGAADIAGFGRLTLPYPRAPADLAENGSLSPGLCSLLEFAESDLLEDEGHFGKHMRHPGAYRDERLALFDGIHELAGDKPLATAFFNRGLGEAYDILRRSSPLPEMSSHIQSEPGGRHPDNLRHLQFMIAWSARRRGLTGMRVPETATGKRIAVIGGGPAGLAATVALLERGHAVDLFEREDRLGGAPALVYPEDRLPDPAAEIDALLEPAPEAGRLTVALGEERSPARFTGEHDAVLVATGCWKERSLGTASGVWPALTFLRAARRGELSPMPERVVVLCGGDAAMDAAVTARALGAGTVCLVFESSRETAHWHLPTSWFEQEGVVARFRTRPTGYSVDDDGALRSVLLEANDAIPADLVIEALSIEAHAIDTASDRVFAAGGMTNGGASVQQCMREGLEVARHIASFLDD